MDVDGKFLELYKDGLGVNFSCARDLKIHLGDKQHPADVTVDCVIFFSCSLIHVVFSKHRTTCYWDNDGQFHKY